MTDALLKSDVPGFPVRHGKVRDIYDLDDKLIIVASDRISAFDCIMPNPIPGKGKLLTELSLFWFDYLKDLTPNHLISADIAEMPEPFSSMPALTGRTIMVKKAEVVPIECVVRGYLAGSGYKEYKASQAICGHKLPEGLKQGSQLPEILFTPSTKATSGHDENISFERCCQEVGTEMAQQLRTRSIAIYQRASEYARSRGLIIADTKFEWGLVDDQLILVDEVLTPDSSRFWSADTWEPGKSQKGFDKQFVRNYLETLDWDKTPPAPELPQDVVNKTHELYQSAVDRLTR
ncbi:MAG: phosphoribosylaminoimidazolesuccinocarboxamide synthase [Planctomycetota bacterium]